jgi:Spherulation-specific family 4
MSIKNKFIYIITTTTFLLATSILCVYAKQENSRFKISKPEMLKSVIAQAEIVKPEIKILIPLYSYPNWYEPDSYIWSKIADSAHQVPITAIINPNNGPGNAPPNRDYQRGIQDLKSGGVTILGYVHTSYGKRNIAEVKSDIDRYAIDFQLDGIFLDEAASGVEQVNYYQEIYQYIKNKSQINQVILNQGTHPDEEYLTKPAADNLVIFENYSPAWDEYQPLAYTDNHDSEHFSTLIHTVTDAVEMKNHIDKAVENNIQYIYITDDSPDNPDHDPWNSLPSFWQEQVNYIESINQDQKNHPNLHSQP